MLLLVVGGFGGVWFVGVFVVGVSVFRFGDLFVVVFVVMFGRDC